MTSLNGERTLTQTNKNPVLITTHASVTQTPKWEQRDQLSQKNGRHATVYMINNDKYLGEWLNNKKHGNGTYIYFKSKSVYEGQWQNDMRNGFGTFSVQASSQSTAKADDLTTNQDDPLSQLQRKINAIRAKKLQEKDQDFTISSIKKKSKAGSAHSNDAFVSDPLKLKKIYAGGWKDDKKHGMGTYFFDDGSFYEGNWECDMREGWGKMFYTDGSVYEGEWHQEKRHGEGALLLANGDRYEGVWMEDKKEGPGRFIYKSKRQMYEGEWSKGLPKCGKIVDLKPFPGTQPRKYPIPPIKLRDPAGIIVEQRELIIEERIATVIPKSTIIQLN
ncbi:hypothetical protein HK098_003851 [Nowakowskiella sp. JEL0407]|nr:hypothetical protein HK098_003851 [Nowakowskiella sp. JEL0407]